jgi:hypothetical protein
VANGLGEDRRKHLELIQGVVNRLAGASFQIKGWTVTIVTALLGVVVAAKLHSAVGLVAVIPAIIFWFLDAYYLRQERLYRDLYNRAFPAGSPVPVYSMQVAEGAAAPLGFRDAFWSKTVVPLYLVIALIVIAFSCLSFLVEFPLRDPPKGTPAAQAGPQDPAKKSGG